MPKLVKAVILLIICIALAGCQPTPSTPPVVNKGDNSLEQKMLKTATSTFSDSQTKIWQETLNKDGIQVNIDADIEKPDVSYWPVVRVTPHVFTLQDAQKAVDVLMKGQTLYEYSPTRSKAEVKQDIIRVESKLEQAKTDKNIDTSYYESELEIYQMEYAKSPDLEPEKKEATLEFKTSSDPSTEVNRTIDVEADLGKPTLARLSIATSNDNMISGLTFFNYDYRKVSFYFFDALDTLPGLNVSKNQALKIAQETLHNLGLTDTQLSYAQAGVDVGGLHVSRFPEALSDPDSKKCYLLHFSKCVKDIPVTNVEFCNGMQSDVSGETYDRVWFSEDIEIAVDDSGVIKFNWISPGDTGETLNANVQIKDFQEIKSIFRKQMFYKRTWTLSGVNDSAITIKRVTMGLMRVRLEESRYVYLPVWDFIGDWARNGHILRNVSFLTINAIDGSIIDRSLGY